MEINLIIRELLAKHNYISLPGIGSFIQKYEPARPSFDEKSFIPPKQTLTFDISRTFNDEAIENYLCDRMGISHSEADDLLKQFIDILNRDLEDGKTISFENVGTLFKNKKGRIKFEQAAELNAALSTYGLKDVEFTKVTPSKSAKSKSNLQSTPSQADTRTKGKSSSNKVVVTISSILVIAALATSFVLIPEFRFWEKFLTTTKNITETKVDTLKVITNKTIVDPGSALVKKDSVSTKIDQEISDNSVKKTALYYEEPKIQDSKTFYLIVGSFGKIENAQKQLEKFRQKGFNPEIIQGKNMFRVSISKTTDKSRAINEFNKFHADYPNEAAWVLGI